MTGPVAQQYGRIITGDDVMIGVKNHLQTWMPGYIAEVARQMEITNVSPIKSWTQRVDFEQLPGDQVPQLVIVVPGLASPPRKTGNGEFEADWAVGIGVVAVADTDVNTLRLVQLYAAAIRSAMLQHASLSGLALHVGWEDERFDDRQGIGLRADDMRSIATASIMFVVTVPSVVDESLGPVTPPDDPDVPPDDWPRVEHIYIDVIGDVA